MKLRRGGREPSARSPCTISPEAVHHQRRSGCTSPPEYSAGLWKVYGDVETAEKTFRKYRKCTELLEKRIRTGCSLDMLTAPEQAPGKEG
ncbi:MAG: DUF3793 family protein [Oscillospiraceae bacterium]|nr:DUF3793 family protein [Oscillospiraceae bacterium]